MCVVKFVLCKDSTIMCLREWKMEDGKWENGLIGFSIIHFTFSIFK